MWLLVATCLLFCSCSSVGDIDNDVLLKGGGGRKGEETFTRMPQIPELSPSIKDPAKWKNGTRLIFFYTPWCSYSEATRPLLYALIEQVYLHNISSMFIGQIDVSIHSDVARTFRVKATPTILMFQNGTRYEFIEEMTLRNLLRFVLRIMSPPMIEVNSSREVRELQKSHKVLFCLVHDHEIHEDWQAMYRQVAQERILVGQFLYTTNPEIINDLGLKLSSLPGVVVLKDGQLYQYQDAILKYRLTLWVESEQFPAMPSANVSSLRYFTTTGTVKRLVVLFVNNEKNRPIPQKKAYEAVRRVAQSRKVHTGYQFLVIEDSELVERVTSTSLSPPALFVWEHHTGYYFLYKNEEKSFTEKGVSSFLYAVTAGKIKGEGGPGFLNSLYNWYWWLYNLIQIMISHRPFLSLVAILLLIFGFVICMYNYKTRPKFNHKRKEAIARARAKHKENLKRRKAEEEEKEQMKMEKVERDSEDNDSYSESMTEETDSEEDKKNK